MRLSGALLGAAAVALAAMVVLAVQPGSSVLPVGLDVQVHRNGGMEVSVDYSAEAARFLYNLSFSVMPVAGPGDLPALVIIDANNRSGASAAAMGLYDHLTTELRLRGVEANVTIVEQSDLLSLLADTSSILIIGEPIARVNSTAAELMDWVLRGGRLVCIGPDSLPFRQIIEEGNWTGPEDFLRVKYQELTYSWGEGMEASPYAEALSLRTVAPYNAMDKGHLDNLSAIPVGYTFHRGETELVTSAMVPLGDGRLVLFGGGLRAPAMTSGDLAVSWDIVQLYLGGAFYSVAAPQHIDLPMSRDARVGAFSVSLDDAPGVVVMAYSDRDYVPAFGRTAVAVAS